MEGRKRQRGSNNSVRDRQIARHVGCKYALRDCTEKAVLYIRSSRQAEKDELGGQAARESSLCLQDRASKLRVSPKTERDIDR